MQFSELFSPARVLTLQPSEKFDVLRQITEALYKMKFISNLEGVYDTIVQREKMMSTGVKRGFAFPHAFSMEFKSTIVSIGIIPGGIPFDSLDGNPVEFIFLLLGPPGNSQHSHLRILARISKVLGIQNMLEMLRSTADDHQALINALIHADRQLSIFDDGASFTDQ